MTINAVQIRRKKCYTAVASYKQPRFMTAPTLNFRSLFGAGRSKEQETGRDVLHDAYIVVYCQVENTSQGFSRNLIYASVGVAR